MCHLRVEMIPVVLACILSQVAAGEGSKITGTVAYRERIALQPDAIVHVKLLDVSREDAPADTIAETEIPTHGKQVPIPYELTYDPGKIAESHRYVVRATIDLDRGSIFTSTAVYPVITKGSPTQVDILLHPIGVPGGGSPAKPRPTGSKTLFGDTVTFAGDLPCADCEGIAHTLTLFPDGIFISRMVYKGRANSFREIGNWSAEQGGKYLILRRGGQAPQRYAIVNPDELRLLDSEGREIDSKMNLSLKRSSEVDPIDEVLRMRGEFSYFADAGLFVDCKSGLRFPVLESGDYAALERAYTGAGLPSAAALVVTVDASVVRREKLEGEGEQEFILVKHFEKAWPGERCSSEHQEAIPLIGTEWKLVEIKGQPIQTATDRQIPTLLLNSEGNRISGMAGCNRYSGTYSIASSGLNLKPGPLTMMACIDSAMKLEKQFIGVLNSINSYRLDGDTLELKHLNDVVARFNAATQ